MMAAAEAAFAFKPGDLVLVKWNDSMVYFAKIKRIDHRRQKCAVVFDDKSQDEADFGQIHSVDETTTDIICIKCKRDDSDTPNEIVLCDRCGIGYHQKCHSPPIPASALELDTPWNCTYCLRGVKCPYLTESLDVLQNLLSDEEGHSHDEVDSVTTAESDEGGDEFTAPLVPQHGKFLAPPKPQKKRGRKPKVKRGPKPKDRSKSPLAVDVRHFKKEDSVESVEMVPSGDPTGSDPAHNSSVSSSSSSSFSTAHREMQLRRKRNQVVSPPAFQKRPRKSSVQSQTLSVTRIPVPVHSESNRSPRSDLSQEGGGGRREDVVIRSPRENQAGKVDLFLPKLSPPGVNSHPQIAGPPLFPSERKPRSLRVSLNLPDEVEPGSPMEKIRKTQRILSPKFAISSLPLWEDGLGPKTTVSGSAATPPMMKSPPSSGGKIITLSSQKSSSESRSPTPKNEGAPLTPFTASALPLQAAGPKIPEEAGERKRKSREEEGGEDTAEVATPKRAKPTLKSPPNSPLEDVFASPIKTEVEPLTSSKPDASPTPSSSNKEETQSVGTQQQQPPPETCPVVTSPDKEKLSNKVALEPVLLPPTTAAPVGYGCTSVAGGGPAAEQEAHSRQNLLTSTNDTPSVVTVQTDRLEVDTSPSLSDTSSVPKVPPIQVAISKPTTELKEGPPVIKSPSSQGVCNQTSPLPKPKSTIVNSTPNPPTVAAKIPTPKTSTQNPSVSVATPQPKVASGATAVSVITSLATTPPSSSGGGVTKQRHSPKSKDGDIIITSVEIRPPRTTAPVVQQPPHSDGLHRSTSSPVASSSPLKLAPGTTAPVAAAKSHPQTYCMSGKQQRAVPGNRVTAKIADAPIPATSQIVTAPVVVQQQAQKAVTPHSGGVKQAQTRPVASQTPVPVVPMVATPTGYPQPLAPVDGTTAYIIPTEAVVSAGQSVAIAVPPPTAGRAVKPGSLPIKESVVQPAARPPPPPPPPTAAAPAVHYIIEPLVPGATTPVIYGQTTEVPVAVTRTQPSLANLPVYHTEVAASKSMPVTTTKPYAIVPAQPTASIEIQGIAVNQQGTPLISPQVHLGYGAVSTTPYIQTVVTPSSDVKLAPQTATGSPSNPKLSKISTGSTQVSQTVRSSSSHTRTQDQQANAQLEEIGKNISDAFASSNEQMLIAAFEDAWKKFQANGKRYQSSNSSSGRKTGGQTETVGKPIPPPNAEVVSVPGTTSRLSLIRPTYSRSKMPGVQSSATADQLVCVPAETQTRLTVAAPVVGDLQQKQQHSVQFIYCSAPSVQPQVYPGASEHPGTALYAVAPNNARSPYEHIVKQPHRSGKLVGSRTTQVQSSGIYIPAHASDISLTSKHQPTAVVVEPVTAGGLNKSMVHVPRSQQQIIVNERGIPVKQPEQVAVQHLSVLKTKPQTIVISGDHQQKQQKAPATTAGVAAAGKAARQCALCTKEATYLCSGCHRIWYCGKECQLKAWEEHSENCRN